MCIPTLYWSFILKIYQDRAELQEVKVMGIFVPIQNGEILQRQKVNQQQQANIFIQKTLQNNKRLTDLLDRYEEGDVGML